MEAAKLFHKIVCPIDLEHSLEILDFAIKVAKQNEASICLLNVVPIPVGAAEVAGFTGDEYPYWETAARERIAKLAAERLEGQVPYEAIVQSGEAAPLIVKTAIDRHADLIVMGTHGRHGVSHFFLGSVAEAVVREAHCAVLTIKPKPQTA